MTSRLFIRNVWKLNVAHRLLRIQGGQRFGKEGYLLLNVVRRNLTIEKPPSDDEVESQTSTKLPLNAFWGAMKAAAIKNIQPTAPLTEENLPAIEPTAITEKDLETSDAPKGTNKENVKEQALVIDSSREIFGSLKAAAEENLEAIGAPDANLAVAFIDPKVPTQEDLPAFEPNTITQSNQGTFDGPKITTTENLKEPAAAVPFQSDDEFFALLKSTAEEYLQVVEPPKPIEKKNEDASNAPKVATNEVTKESVATGSSSAFFKTLKEQVKENIQPIEPAKPIAKKTEDVPSALKVTMKENSKVQSAAPALGTNLVLKVEAEENLQPIEPPKPIPKNNQDTSSALKGNVKESLKEPAVGNYSDFLGALKAAKQENPQVKIETPKQVEPPKPATKSTSDTRKVPTQANTSKTTPPTQEKIQSTQKPNIDDVPLTAFLQSMKRVANKASPRFEAKQPSRQGSQRPTETNNQQQHDNQKNTTINNNDNSNKVGQGNIRTQENVTKSDSPNIRDTSQSASSKTITKNTKTTAVEDSTRNQKQRDSKSTPKPTPEDNDDDDDDEEEESGDDDDDDDDDNNEKEQKKRKPVVNHNVSRANEFFKNVDFSKGGPVIVQRNQPQPSSNVQPPPQTQTETQSKTLAKTQTQKQTQKQKVSIEEESRNADAINVSEIRSQINDDQIEERRSLTKIQKEEREILLQQSNNILNLLPKTNSDEVWIGLSDVSPCFTRFDLIKLLRYVQPISIEPLVEADTFLPAGKYALLMPNQDAVDVLEDLIEQERLLETEDPIKLVKHIDQSKLHLASNCQGILLTDRTVLIYDLHPLITKDHLFYWLEENGSRLETIRLLASSENHHRAFFLDFESKGDATKFIFDKGGSILAGKQISLCHYTF